MKWLLGTLRVVETVFLFGFIAEFEKTIVQTADGLVVEMSESWTVLSLGFDFALDGASGQFVLSTLFFGYLVSTFATFFQRNQRKTGLWKFSLVLSLLGVASYANEAHRFFTGGGFQFLASFPILLVIVDWLLFKSALSAGEKPRAEDAEEESA